MKLPTIQCGSPPKIRQRKTGPSIASQLRAMKPGTHFVVRPKEAPKWRTMISQRDFKGQFLTYSTAKGVCICKKEGDA